MQFPLYWVDAFTSRVFGGNPAAVVPLDHWLPDTILQIVAFENGLSETAFFVRTGDTRAHLRWFTPAVEVDLCGHATLATAHVCFTHLGFPGNTVTFDTRSGALPVARDAGLLTLDFPVRPAQEVACPRELSQGLGATPGLVLRTPRLWMAVFPDSSSVAQLRPDHAALRTLTPGRIVVTAPGVDCDFVSRFFAYDAGIDEDPVTGSTHCTLTPYWAERLGRDRLHARQVSRRGGELWCRLLGERVEISGEARDYLRGIIEVPA